MADGELDAQLAALEDAAPLTIEGEAEDVTQDTPDTVADDAAGKNAKAKDEKADDWKPPTREEVENKEKAWRADREAAREAKRQAQRYEQNIMAMEQRFQQWQQQQIAQHLQRPAPDPWQDPEGAKAWAQQQQQLQQQLWQAQQQREQQEAQRIQADRQFQQLNESVDDYESEFTKTNPDYHEATDHMLKIQQRILENSGYPPHIAAEQVAIWSANIAQMAVNAGRNPAEMAYTMAQEMGYVPASKRNGGAQAAAEKLAAIKAGQGSAQTLSGGGAAGGGRPSLKSIANLEGAAFDSAMDKWLNDSIKGR